MPAPTIDDVIAAATDTLQKAYDVKGTPSPMAQLTTALAHATQLQTALDAETVDDAAQQARIAAAKTKAQDVVAALS